MTSFPTPTVSLKDDELSAMYISSDHVSSRGQKRTRTLVKLELSGLIIASIAGVSSYRVGIDQLDLLAAVSGLAFAGSLIFTTIRVSQKPEGDWYAGRAAAESIRTMGWRYAVGGDPFPNTVPAAEASARFLTRLEAILRELRETDLSSRPRGAHEITSAMDKVRATDFHTRRLIYQRDRIEDQLNWYQRRTFTHKKRLPSGLLSPFWPVPWASSPPDSSSCTRSTSICSESSRPSPQQRPPGISSTSTATSFPHTVLLPAS